MPHPHRYHLLLLVPLLALTLTGCGATPKLAKPDADNVSLMFGHLDMGDAPSDLDWVQMKRMKPLTKTPYYNFWVVDGAFFRGDVPEGTYKFTQFGGHSGWKNTSYTYNFPEQGKGELDGKVQKPGLYFAGTYRYKKIDTGFFEPDKFDLVKTDSPTELELLQKILPYAQDDYWKTMIGKRIRELKK